jgi:hypothetical protein
MFAMDVVQMLADSLVREHLSRKGWKKTLRVLDEESPRREDRLYMNLLPLVCLASGCQTLSTKVRNSEAILFFVIE